jgi:hypothetical protein
VIVVFTMSNPGSSSDDPTSAPQTSLQDATKLVLGALSNIRKTPELRRNFASGNRNALEAVEEVRDIFQSKKKKHQTKVSKASVCSSQVKRKKRTRKYFKLVAFQDQMLLLIHPSKIGTTFTLLDWEKHVKDRKW